MMATIASHTSRIKTRNEVNWAIDSFVNDRPYARFLAVPICSEESDCHQTAVQMSHSYVNGIINEIVKPYVLDDDQNPKD